METAVILIQCPDRTGIIARVSDFIFRKGANIIRSDQYSTDPRGGRFFMRIEFFFDPDTLRKKTLESEFDLLARELEASWEIHYAGTRMRMGILVSRQGHCLWDLLYRWDSGELPVDLTCVISNHENMRRPVEHYGVPFYHFSVSRETKPHQEKQILETLGDRTDFLALARYMQVLSGSFIEGYGRDIINIHHSFLPSFKGADPYRQAYERGVKVIGATSHFVTEDLDEGPIIEQVVERVTHKDSVDLLKRKGRNLEKIALANAVQAYIEHRIIRFGHKTIVFD